MTLDMIIVVQNVRNTMSSKGILLAQKLLIFVKKQMKNRITSVRNANRIIIYIKEIVFLLILMPVQGVPYLII